MTDNDALQIARIDVEAARNDHVLLAVHQGQEALFIKPADIARADIAKALWTDPLGLCGLARLVVIAVHHGGGATNDLANLACRQFTALFVD